MKKTLSLALIATFLCCWILGVAHGDVKKRRINIDDLSEADLSQFLDDILHKRDQKEGKSPKTCISKFEEEEGFILRTRDSVHNGAEFITAPSDVDTADGCKEACCDATSKKTSRRCDLAVFQKDNIKDDSKPRCYLFSCTDKGGDDVCLTAANEDYKLLRINNEKVEDELLNIASNESTVKKEGEKTENEDRHGTCLKQFTKESGNIIRTHDSIKNGALFLKAPSATNTAEKCQAQCCVTTDAKSSRHCDLAVFQTNDDDPSDDQPRCYLFSCTDDNGQFRCDTSPNNDYVVMKRKVDVTEDQLIDVATSTTEKTTTTTDTTSASTTTTESTIASTTTTMTPPPAITKVATHTCKRLEWQCDNGECVKVTEVCNKNSDCSDESDENDCESITEESNMESKVAKVTPTLSSTTTSKVTMSPVATTTTTTASTASPVTKTSKNPQVGDSEDEKSPSAPDTANFDGTDDDFKVERTEPQKGAVLPLALGLSVTACVLFMVGCRMHIMKKKLRRRGKPLSMEESDYLINGMYL